jgi:hypothetical protein
MEECSWLAEEKDKEGAEREREVMDVELLEMGEIGLGNEIGEGENEGELRGLLLGLIKGLKSVSNSNFLSSSLVGGEDILRSADILRTGGGVRESGETDTEMDGFLGRMEEVGERKSWLRAGGIEDWRGEWGGRSKSSKSVLREGSSRSTEGGERVIWLLVWAGVGVWGAFEGEEAVFLELLLDGERGFSVVLLEGDLAFLGLEGDLEEEAATESDGTMTAKSMLWSGDRKVSSSEVVGGESLVWGVCWEETGTLLPQPIAKIDREKVERKEWNV